MNPPLPRIFAGATALVVAGGPSLRGFDFGRLDPGRCIAINRAYEVLPAEVLWWSDALFFRAHKDALEAHPARFKATGQLGYMEGELPDWVCRYNFTGNLGWDDDPRCLRTGNNGTYVAIQLAAKLGAARIVLLGVDMMHGPAGETHWHEGHGRLHHESVLTQLMLPHFIGLVEPLQHLGVEVINASPESRLTTWPRVTIEEGLKL